MFYRLKQLGRQSAVYGFFDAVGRLGSLLLVPLYADRLGAAGYGSLELLQITYALGVMLVVMGMNSSLTRHYLLAESEEERRRYLAGSFSLVLVVAAAATAILWGLSPAIARLVESDVSWTGAWRTVFLTMFVDALGAMGLALLRAREQALRFSLVNLTRLFTSLLFNLWFLVGLDWGVEGILRANLLGSVAALLLLAVQMGRELRFSLDGAYVGPLVRFGFPLIASGIATFGMNNANRYLLRILSTTEDVGVYALAFKVGMVMSLTVTAFTLAWPPALFQIYKTPHAKETYAKVLTYVLLVTSALLVGLTSFRREIVDFISPPEFALAADVLPWILLGNLLYGVFNIFLTGPVVLGRTRSIPLVVWLGLLASVALNLVLIPRAGVMGAAWATVGGYVVMAGGMYLFNQKLYPIPFEWRRVARLAVLVGILVVINGVLLAEPSLRNLALKIGVLVAAVPALYFAGVLDDEEKKRLMGRLRTRLRK